MKGLEPPRLSAPDPKSGAATNYATSAKSAANLVSFFVFNKSKMDNLVFLLKKRLIPSLLNQYQNLLHFKFSSAQFKVISQIYSSYIRIFGKFLCATSLKDFSLKKQISPVGYRKSFMNVMVGY